MAVIEADIAVYEGLVIDVNVCAIAYSHYFQSIHWGTVA